MCRKTTTKTSFVLKYTLLNTISIALFGYFVVIRSNNDNFVRTDLDLTSMKNIALFLFIFLVTTSSIHAKKIPGQIVIDGKTTDVILKIPIRLFERKPVLTKLQYRLAYYLPGSNEKQILAAEEVDEVRFSYGRKQYKLVKKQLPFNTDKLGDRSAPILLQEVVSGELNLYAYHWQMQTSRGNLVQSRRYLLQRLGEDVKKLRGLSQKSDLAEIIKDCPEAISNLNNRHFRQRDLPEIVQRYNTTCSTK